MGVALPEPVVSERNRLDVQCGEPSHRGARSRIVVAEEGAGVCEATPSDLEDVAGEEEPMAWRPQTDAARRVPRRVDDLEAAKHRDHVAVDDGRRLARVRRDEMKQVPAGPGVHDLLKADADTFEVIRMDEHLRPACSQLSHAANVIGMAVGADDPIELAEITADLAQVADEWRLGSWQAGVDEGEPLLGDQVAGAAQQFHRVQARDDLRHRASIG